MKIPIIVLGILFLFTSLGLAGRWDSQEVPEQPTQHQLEWEAMSNE